MRVLVCGGTEYKNRAELYHYLYAIHAKRKIGVIIHGAAPGADTMAGEWARLEGVEEIAEPANWDRLGNAAGPHRNTRMLQKHEPELVVAFYGDKGTRNMVMQASLAGIKVIKVNWPKVTVDE